jgi:hypothetical protein
MAVAESYCALHGALVLGYLIAIGGGLGSGTDGNAVTIAQGAVPKYLTKLSDSRGTFQTGQRPAGSVGLTVSAGLASRIVDAPAGTVQQLCFGAEEE